MKRGITQKQHDISDCGAACLCSVSAYFGCRIPLARIRHYASTNRKGTNLLGLTEAAGKIGLSAKAVRGPAHCLKDIPLPAIAHMLIDGKLFHYVVIYKVSRGKIRLMDPATGRMMTRGLENFLKEWTGILILLAPADDFEKTDQATSPLARFLTLLKPHKTIIFQALSGALVYSIAGLSMSVYVQKIVDHVLTDQNQKLLTMMSVIMLIILFFKTFIGVYKNLIMIKTGQKIDAVLVLGYYRHLLSLPRKFFDSMQTGEIISRVNDAVKIRNFLCNISVDLCVNLLIIIFTTLLMLAYSPYLALMVMGLIPVLSCIYYFFNRFNRKYARKIMESSAELESQFVESISCITTVKQLAGEHHQRIKTENRLIRVLKNSYISSRSHNLVSNLIQGLAGMTTVFVLWAGSMQVIGRHTTPGELMSFYALMGYLINPVLSTINMNRSIQDALVAADRLFQIIDLETEKNTGNMIEIDRKMPLGDIRFINVSFRYGSEKPVFQGLNLTIPGHSISVIAGENGSGKSTLISLLNKMYPPVSGQIKLGQYDIDYIRSDSLRKLIGIVPQRPEFMEGNIFENIAFGNPGPDTKKVIDICHYTGIQKMIDAFPEKYYTRIGENGHSLSGGEKQKIAFARALYNDPGVIVLDEPCSSLDPAAEENLLEILYRLREEKKTILVITHKLNIARNADLIFFLSRGKLLEKGTHRELLAKTGDYHHFWEKQIYGKKTLA